MLEENLRCGTIYCWLKARFRYLWLPKSLVKSEEALPLVSPAALIAQIPYTPPSTGPWHCITVCTWQILREVNSVAEPEMLLGWSYLGLAGNYPKEL